MTMVSAPAVTPVLPPVTGESPLPLPPSSLLPDPVTGGDLAGLEVLLLMESRQRQDSTQRSMQRVAHARARSRAALADARRALARAARAARKAERCHGMGRLLGKVVKVAGVVAAIAASFASCGMAAPLAAVAIAGAVVSTSACVLGETRALEALGMSEKTSAAFLTGMVAVGALATGGAGFASALGVAGAAAGTATAAEATASVAGGVAAGAGTGVAATELRAASWEHRDKDARTDSLACQHDQARVQRLVLELLVELEAEVASADRNTQVLAGAIEIRATTIAMAGGVAWTA